MTRKPTLLIFVTLLLTIGLIASGCNRSATPKMQTDPIPEDEGTTMIDDATQNTENMQTPEATTEGEPTAVSVGGGEPTTDGAEATESTATPETTDPTATPTPTPAPTATPEPEATEAATAEATEETVTLPGTHTVKAGENLFRIALGYGLTTEAVAQANNITNPALIHPGQVLTIPSGGSSGGTTGGAPTTSDGDIIHTVAVGDNLFRIALKYNYDQYYIARYNNIANIALIYPGQQIRIPQN